MTTHQLSDLCPLIYHCLLQTRGTASHRPVDKNTTFIYDVVSFKRQNRIIESDNGDALKLVDAVIGQAEGRGQRRLWGQTFRKFAFTQTRRELSSLLSTQTNFD